jgi:two-component system nitrate/nitrite response regulator NarL
MKLSESRGRFGEVERSRPRTARKAGSRRRATPTVLIGPSPLVREGLARVIGGDFRVIGSAASIDSIVLSSTAPEQPVLLIVDAGDNAAAAVIQVALFRRQNPKSRIAFLADDESLNNIVVAFRAGANAYFAKAASCETFVKLLELLMLGQTILPSSVLSLIVNEDVQKLASTEPSYGPIAVLGGSTNNYNTPRLSAREKRILRCLVEGDQNKAIARKVDIAEATVKVHVKAILRKIRVHNRTQAAIWALNNKYCIWGTDNERSTLTTAASSQPKISQVPAPSQAPDGSTPPVAEH